jgi:preprotein translocase subunit SecD
MLSISRWMAAAILVTVTTVSAMAIPNFLSDKTFHSLPRWAQHRVVPDVAFQVSTHQLLAVDTDSVRKQTVEEVRDEVRKSLRQARIGLVQAPVVRGNAVEVRIRENDLDRGLVALREYFMVGLQHGSAAAKGAPIYVPPGAASVRSVNAALAVPADVTFESVGGGLVRVVVTEAAINERIRKARQHSIDMIRGSVRAMGFHGAIVVPRGTDRIEVMVPGALRPIWFELIS